MAPDPAPPGTPAPPPGPVPPAPPAPPRRGLWAAVKGVLAPGLGKTWAFAVAAFVGVLLMVLLIFPECRDAYNDTSKLAEERFESYSSQLLLTITDLEASLDPASPAHAALRKAHDSHRVAQIERWRNLEAATRQLDAANEYLCEVKQALVDDVCSPIKAEPLKLLNDPRFNVAVAGIAAVADGAATTLASVNSVRSWLLKGGGLG